ncbi:MAG: hypothetical protein ACI9QD_000977 [Thermoproteota archaeon]|jgi:hypothetical protein
MSDDDDNDEATVVLDLNKLKEELARKNDLSSGIEDLEFIAGTKSETQEEESKLKFKVIFFDYKVVLFEINKELFPQGYDYTISTDVKHLSGLLKTKDFQIVVFNYAGDPKSVNTLCAQVKAKFPSTKTIIVAKNLAPAKAKAHQATSSGANGYMNLPLTTEKMEEEFTSIYNATKA